MSIKEFIEDAELPRGGTFVPTEEFSQKGQKIGGILRDIKVMNRTDPEGNIVRGRKSGEPRKVYRVIFEVPDTQRTNAEDDGLRIWEANEGGQTAVRAAYKAVGTTELIGGQFSARVVEEAPDKWSQCTYQAKFEPAPKTVELPDADPESDPW